MAESLALFFSEFYLRFPHIYPSLNLHTSDYVRACFSLAPYLKWCFVDEGLSGDSNVITLLTRQPLNVMPGDPEA